MDRTGDDRVGGYNGSVHVNTGAKYNTTADAWIATSLSMHLMAESPTELYGQARDDRVGRLQLRAGPLFQHRWPIQSDH